MRMMIEIGTEVALWDAEILLFRSEFLLFSMEMPLFCIRQLRVLLL